MAFARARLAAFVVLAACTPIRGLDAPTDDAARADSAIVDANVPRDAPAIDLGIDAGCAAADLCDGRDDDCDSATVDGSGEPSLGMACDGMDSDECAEGVTSCAGGALSCSDVTTGTIEVCSATAGADEDCDGTIDEAGAMGATAYYPDGDHDGYGTDLGVVMACAPPMGMVARGGDCDDTDATVRPGRGEGCDGVDQDCNGSIDDGIMCETACTRGELAGHAYQLCTNARPQATAESRCIGMGYHLAQIEDAAENDYLRTLLGTTFPATGDAWIGLEADASVPPVYTWPDGSLLTYVVWDATTMEPNHSGTCVRLRSPGWADAPCGMSYPYLCEADPR